MARKNIALFTALPESVHARNVISGVTRQCLKYDYNVIVFASMMHLESYWKEYLQGEKRVYSLADPDEIDGVILDMTNLIEGKDQGLISEVKDVLRVKPNLPVVTLELPEGDYPVIPNRNEECLREMARHVIEKHGKKRLCILTGQKGYPISESRLGILLDEIQKHGLTVDTEHVIYGDFWYDSGDQLGKDLLEGKISLPDAILCASDFTALGLLDRLAGSKIRVPQDLLVIGFDTMDEGRCNDVVLSSFETADVAMAGDAVDYLRRIMDPEGEITPYPYNYEKSFHPGASCGCEPDYPNIMKTMRKVTYFTSHNNTTIGESMAPDFGTLMESYQMENFAVANTPEECFRSIGESIYLMRPFQEFSLYIRENWLEGREDEWPEHLDLMKRVIWAKEGDDSDCAFVRYFSAIHFKGDFMGYAVLQRSLQKGGLLDQYYRTWLRFVNNALEMVRAKQQLMILSLRDGMTGLYNRRGMEIRLREMLDGARLGDSLFAAVIDMDGLKRINDNYGHGEGDFGIRTVSSAVAHGTKLNEICVRAGGDEFYILGVGTYKAEDMQTRKNEIADTLAEIMEGYQKPYLVSVSIGCVLSEINETLNVDAVITLADEEMYREKTQKKQQRVD